MKMKKCLAIILALVMALGCMSITAFAADLTGFAGGTGTESDPYQIATLEQLENLATIVNGGNNCAGIYFVLTADIGTTETPVTKGIGDSYWSPFGGYLDGQNHTVTLDINRDDDEGHIGLIGYSYDGTISNVNIAGSVSAKGLVGGVCGRKEGGTIINCHNSATLTYSNEMGMGMGSYTMGGVCGTAEGCSVINCSNSGAVTVSDRVMENCSIGGVCGSAQLGATIANCYNSGAVSGTSEEQIGRCCFCGGICGDNDSASIINCYSSGAVSGTEAREHFRVGGVCGSNWSSVSNCYYNNEICTIGGVNGSDGSDPATGLTTEQCKAASGTENALVDKLNNYTDNSGSYPEGWEKWAFDENGYPTFASLVPEEPSGTTCHACNGTGKNPGVTAAEAALDAAQSASEAITVINNPMDNSSFATACENLLIAGDAASDAALAVEAAIAYDISGHLSTILEKLPSIGTKAAEYIYYSSQADISSTIQASTALIELTAAAEAIIDAASGYLDEAEENCPVCGGTGMIEGSSFLTSFTLSKDYNDKYTADTKSTAVNETVSFTITPVTTGAPAFSETATTESPFTFTMTVTDGVGEAEVDLPDTDDITSVGEYWYTITETAGTTAGVTYDNTTYYLHLIVSYKDGEFGFSSAAIHTTENGASETDAKITLVSNSYGEGTLTVAQETTVNGEDSDEDTFEVTVTFTAPTGTTVIGDITYGDDQTVAFENGVGTAVIELKGGESVTFEHIPDGVTYTVVQTGKNEDKGYTLDEVAFDVTDETGDSVTNNIASGTIGDAADTVTITNSKTVPIDVGVILENGAFIVLALGALIAAAWLIVSKRRKSVDAE